MFLHGVILTLKLWFALYNMFDLIFNIIEKKLVFNQSNVNIYFISFSYIIGTCLIVFKPKDTMYKIYCLYILDIIYTPYILYYTHNLEKIETDHMKDNIITLVYFYSFIYYFLAINAVYNNLKPQEQQYTSIQ